MMKVKLPVPVLSLLSFVILMSCHSKSAGSGVVEVRELDGAWWFISPGGGALFFHGSESCHHAAHVAGLL